MRGAVIDKSGRVVNVIVAHPDDPMPPGHILVGVPDELGVDSRWLYSSDWGFKPNQELQKELDAIAAADAAYREQRAREEAEAAAKEASR